MATPNENARVLCVPLVAQRRRATSAVNLKLFSPVAEVHKALEDMEATYPAYALEAIMPADDCVLVVLRKKVESDAPD
jgi:hypothetical protein